MNPTRIPTLTITFRTRWSREADVAFRYPPKTRLNQAKNFPSGPSPPSSGLRKQGAERRESERALKAERSTETAIVIAN